MQSRTQNTYISSRGRNFGLIIFSVLLKQILAKNKLDGLHTPALVSFFIFFLRQVQCKMVVFKVHEHVMIHSSARSYQTRKQESEALFNLNRLEQD